MTRKSMLKAYTALFLLLATPALAEEDGAALYTGFTLVDPEAATLTDNAWILVRGERIEQIGSGALPDGEFERHDMTGLYAMPGLIDAHGHITGGPQHVYFEDGEMRIELRTGDEFTRGNAAVALAFGTTSMRNPGGSSEAASRYDQMLAGGDWVGPEVRHAGEIIQPSPFVGESFAYPTTPEEWDAEAARQADAGMTYFKLYTNLTEEEIALGAAAAKAHGLIPIAHLNGVSWTRALDLGVEQFEHALPTSPDLLEPEMREQYVMGPDFMTRWWELADLDGPLIEELVEQLARHDAEVDLTVMVNEMLYFTDEWTTRFPELAGEETPDYMHPELVASITPNYESMQSVPSEQTARSKAVWPKVLAFLKLLHDSGVNLMIGTDGTGGFGLQYELANHVEAGIPTWEVLRMVTSGNAGLIDMTDTGRLVPGKEADIVFLRANPVDDVANVNEVAFVVSNGMFYEHEELLDIARGIAAEARARNEESANQAD